MLSREETWRLVSFLLTYPEEGCRRVLQELQTWVADAEDAMALQALKSLLAADPDTLVRVYVETFDFSTKTTLYLTYHEFGDDRARGNALLALHQQLRSAGLEPVANELPDFLPLLFEFLAEWPPLTETDLPGRMSAAIEHILATLSKEHLYRPAFELARRYLPDPVVMPRPLSPREALRQRIRSGSGSAGGAGAVGTGVEDAPMPYPIFYD
ncbi:nitrate reductase molybdenum cofactor assembly chaperone [Alicyclobacillus herbarius]|uniref:nitrate reductase molybdenum cofactor assembly chaperone n=1 Tax=Alicyclobacillus herbarius TaxID=122960 RepID=UPI00040F9C67|nr:nitrate reductase molybdenum cofactor assembly chaperone [Alicyclobacillus herbarius]